MSCGNRNVSVTAGQGVFQLFYLLKGQLCALCNLPHSKFKDLRLRLRLIGTSFSLPLFLSMFFYSFFQLGRIQHIILNHQDVHILVVCMAFLRKAYSTAAKHRFNQSEYTLPAILSHFIDKRYIFSSNRQTAWTDITCFSYLNKRYLFSTNYQTNGKYSMKKQYKSFQESSVKVTSSLFK